jgi:putative ATPase
VYPHSHPEHYIHQQYLPNDIKDKRYYRPTTLGYEKQISAYLDRTKYRKEDE